MVKGYLLRMKNMKFVKFWVLLVVNFIICHAWFWPFIHWDDGESSSHQSINHNTIFIWWWWEHINLVNFVEEWAQSPESILEISQIIHIPPSLTSTYEIGKNPLLPSSVVPSNQCSSIWLSNRMIWPSVKIGENYWGINRFIAIIIFLALSLVIIAVVRPSQLVSPRVMFA